MSPTRVYMVSFTQALCHRSGQNIDPVRLFGVREEGVCVLGGVEELR